MSIIVKAEGPSGRAKIRSDDPKHALGLVQYLRTIGYSAWIEDTNGNEIDEKTLNMAIAGDADNALDQVLIVRPMHSQMHYLPLAPGFFAILVGFFLIVLVLRSVRYAYESLGVSSNTAVFLLFATLIGSIFNIPIAELPPERAMSHHVIDFFGMRYAVPAVSHWRGTVVAVNVGGAVIPTLMSIYLLIKRELWAKGLLATAIVALVIHWMADPVPGLGIAVPVFMPVVVTAIVAMILSREDSAPLAYIAGSLGTLIGADLTNLNKVRGLGAPIASIGGAGTFDGIFLTGILAVLLASLYARPRAARAG